MLYKLTPNITVIGKVIIRPERSFSFLAYLVTGSKNILIDTLPIPAGEIFLEELKSCVALDKLDAVIINHSESDHSGSLNLLSEQCPNLPVYCSDAGKEILQAAYPTISSLQVVTNGSSLQIGDLTFSFTYTPGLHWADNMVTYLEGERILFSNDLFGQSLGMEIPLDSQVSEAALLIGAKNYFEKVFSTAPPESMAILPHIIAKQPRLVAPGHGVVLQEHLAKIFDYYQMMCVAK